MRRSDFRDALRRELEHRIQNGRCVYCRAPAAPDQPLTREHVIPRARGGRRKDLRIIVPACARCNQTRGCQEVVLFLLARPRRIAAFLDYLSALPPEVVRELDPRVFAELYAAVGLLTESAARGREWRDEARRLCTGRRLHRRRYRARRVLAAVDGRMERHRSRASHPEGPSCLVPGDEEDPPQRGMERTSRELRASLIGILAVVWEVSAERVLREVTREAERRSSSGKRARARGDAAVVSLDGWKRRKGKRRVRVDRRRGRGGGRAA